MDTVEIPGGYLVPCDSHVGKWQQECGRLDHDEFTVPLACEHIPIEGTVIDCGAFNGDHTIAYSHKVGSRGLVIAFEPGAIAYKCLEHNARKFPSQTLVVNGALSDKDNEKVGHEVNENLGASRCGGEGNILTYTLDGFLEATHIHRLDFIKMDCEGWELKVLRGGAKMIQRFRPTMLIEINAGALEEQGASYKEISDLLREWKYEWQVIQPECENISIFSYPQFDILCTPSA